MSVGRMRCLFVSMYALIVSDAAFQNTISLIQSWGNDGGAGMMFSQRLAVAGWLLCGPNRKARFLLLWLYP